MFKRLYSVNNQETIRKLANTSFKANKLRNLFCVVAIILTTLLFTALFSITNNLLSAMETYTMRMVGGSAHGSFKYLTQEEYDNLKDHKSIADISYSVVLGIAQNHDLKKRPTEIRFSSGETNAKGTFSMPTTGGLPASGNELATDTIVLKALGIPAELGQKVTINYTLDDKAVESTFILVGFWEGDKVSRASQMWLSRDYVVGELANYQSKGKGDAIGSISADVTFNNTFLLEKKLQKVILDSGYSLNDIAYGVNWAYTGNANKMDAGTAISLIGLIVVIGFSGYLMISNVFYISVARDIQYFGLLKTVGTTGKQIASIVRHQGLLMCTIGVPVGLLAGTFIGLILTPILFSIFNMDMATNQVVPLVLICSTLFTTVTVVLSIGRPAKLAGRVSPIQALSTGDITEISKKTTRENFNEKAGKKAGGKARKNRGVTPFNMAIRNVLRHKKKATLVTISLTLSLMIINGAFSLANSFDMDRYLKDMINGDFTVADSAYFTPWVGYAKHETLNSNFFDALETNFENATINNVYYEEIYGKIDPQLLDMPARFEKLPDMRSDYLEEVKNQLEFGFSTLSLYGLDDSLLGQLEVLEGNLDLAKLKTGNYVVVAPHDDDGIVKYYEIGDKITIARVDGITKTYEVLAIANIPYALSVQRYHTLSLQFFLPSTEFLKGIVIKAPMLTTIDVADEQTPAMENFLSNYCEHVNEDLQYKSKAMLVAEFENMQTTFKTVGLTLGLIVALIGTMNFTNTTITSIMARKRELAMLQSVGMTKKQMLQMLFFEGISYTVLTACLTFTLGSFLIYYGIRSLLSGSSFATPNVTLLPSLLVLPILVLISMIVPLVSQKMIIGKSLVESLRGID